MQINSEAEMLAFGEKYAKSLTFPAAIELIGDVGAGKTTFVRGLAKGLGITEPVTSPSFTISKTYAFPDGILSHYDFYRLTDPGLMSNDLADTLATSSIVVVEWGTNISGILPKNRHVVKITTNPDNSRSVTLE